MNRLRPKLSYANVVSTLCLFLILGGAAWAAVELPRNSVGTKQIKNDAVTLSKISESVEASLRGEQGEPGVDGASIVARARFSGLVTTTDSPTVLPLTGNTWTQQANEVDQVLKGGALTFTPPNSPDCGSSSPGLATLRVAVDPGGGQMLIGTLTNGVQRTVQLTDLDNDVVFEPGVDTPRSLDITVFEDCSDPGATFDVTDAKVDVVGYR